MISNIALFSAMFCLISSIIYEVFIQKDKSEKRWDDKAVLILSILTGIFFLIYYFSLQIFENHSKQAFTEAAKLIIRYVSSLVRQSNALGIAANLAVVSATCELRQTFG